MQSTTPQVMASPSPVTPTGTAPSSINQNTASPLTTHKGGPLFDSPPAVDACDFADGLTGWTVKQSDGTATGQGYVAAQNGHAVMHEGDSFIVTLQRTFVIPNQASSLSFGYDISFGAIDPHSIRDAFEADLVDSSGHTLVHPRPLAAVIGRLALSRKQIQELPDNYAAAVTSGRFASRFDPEKPDQSYLPPDLFAANGPWVCVGRTDSITAPEHLGEPERTENRFTNSVFLVFLRLPPGRAATVDPKLTLPEGTQFALVRRALLIDTSHRVASTTLTESVQVRVAVH
jgi:hypothetical protein